MIMEKASIATKFWRETIDLSLGARLLCTYLYTNEHLKICGVVETTAAGVADDLQFTVDMLRDATRELIEKKHVKVVKVDGYIYFILIKFDRYNNIKFMAKYREGARNALRQLPMQVRKETSARA